MSRHTVYFLLASALFRDGLAGVFAFGAVLAAGTFGLSAGDVIVFGAAANIVAGFATMGFGLLDDRITWTWDDHAANEAQARDLEVDRSVATQFAARARQEAVRLNRHGDYQGARHLLEATAQTVSEVVRWCAGVRFIVTSREPLRVDGEVSWRTPSIALPDPGVRTSLKALAEIDADGGDHG